MEALGTYLRLFRHYSKSKKNAPLVCEDVEKDTELGIINGSPSMSCPINNCATRFTLLCMSSRYYDSPGGVMIKKIGHGNTRVSSRPIDLMSYNAIYSNTKSNLYTRKGRVIGRSTESMRSS